ncbi:hypothetical protein GS538_01790 [Rhodococcus hoagii]|nr:hypothetical protein [Prescottella equi]
MPEYRVTVEQNQGQTPAWTITFLAEGWTTGVRRSAGSPTSTTRRAPSPHSAPTWTRTA